ncbi:MAG: hypothetical protein HFG42_17335 [Lachnospiraceae bacterium]|jgi:HJR/Mrr/RecB family endonuclease|nr:hypothetical protein [Lachnospiraceae bacterium]
MSIKGISKEIFVKKDFVIILNFFGQEKYIKYEDLKRIEYYFAKMFTSGYIIFVKKTNEEERVDFRKKNNEDVLKLIESIKINFSHINFWEISKEHNTMEANSYKEQNTEFKKEEKASPFAQYVQSKLYEASELADIVNSTTDENTFKTSLNKIIIILTDLQKYEDIINFQIPPSKQLRTILDNKEKTYNLLQERINNKSVEKPQQLAQKINTDLYLKSNLDPLFVDAGRFVIEKNKAAIGMLQRWFKVGFNRAAHIIDQLSECGVLGEESGTKPREILMSIEEFEFFIARTSIKVDSDYAIVLNQLKRIDELKSIIHTSISQNEFALSLNELCQILDKLNSYEGKIELPINPSDELKKIKESRSDLFDLFYQRYRESNSINKTDEMTGQEFEAFCSNLLKKNGFINVKLTKASRDHGIDILAEKDEVTYAIQCKCYSSNIGNSAVQQAHTGKSIYHKDIAVVMTNSHFTAQAIKDAELIGVKLWDREKLSSMIGED